MSDKTSRRMDLTNFQSIFLKGIFKDVVSSVVDIIKDFKRIECPSQSIDIHTFGVSSNIEESLQ